MKELIRQEIAGYLADKDADTLREVALEFAMRVAGLIPLAQLKAWHQLLAARHTEVTR